MKILSMTATFGKLSNQTLTLNPDFNIIEAPNEWGKSTWCAFLMAMLYGIDTSSRNKTGFLADKEHYAPWSGQPMSGSMEILWNGRHITLERHSKGRTPMGEVRAFETETGVPVPELAVAAPGQVLLGVERSVFARAGFLKLSEMPVTEDEALRRRLNELVTTGDESGTSDALAQKLKDLRNKCKSNSKKGLLPELEEQKAQVEQKLQQIQSLERQIANFQSQQESLQTQTRLLENHKQSLEYNDQLRYAQKLAAAEVNLQTARTALDEAEETCKNLPTQEKLRQDLAVAQQMRETREALNMQSHILPPLPPMPQCPEAFRGKQTEKLIAEAESDTEALAKLQADKKKHTPYILGGISLAVAIGLALTGMLALQIVGGLFLLCGAGLLIAGFNKQKKLALQISQIMEKYRGIPENAWISAATDYVTAQQNYEQALAERQQELAEFNAQLERNSDQIATLTGGKGLAYFEETCRENQQKYIRWQEQQRIFKQAEDVLQALTGAGKTVQPPAFEDTLGYTAQETAQRLSDIYTLKQKLQLQMGQCQGQMQSLGQTESLLAEKSRLQDRIAQVEKYYNALTRAQETLVQATQELQRRFAPRLSQRAQELFGRLTGNRYHRLSLRQDLSLEVSAEGENTLRGTLWRSDGTVDQLYLALRLAVAEELIPTAPLVLDDALVRFDDTRLSTAIDILRQQSENKQVILFTCQSREKEMTK